MFRKGKASQKIKKTESLKGLPFPVQLIRSARSSCQIQIRPDGMVLVRMPFYATKKDAEELVGKHREWIRNKLAAQQLKMQGKETAIPFTAAEKAVMRKKAGELIPPVIEKYEGLLGVDHSTVSYRFQKTRWGSCSRKGGLNFNCLLVLCPAEVLESVVAHELCHRRHMDHSAAFYQDLSSVFPRYRECRGWLKEHGEELMERL